MKILKVINFGSLNIDHVYHVEHIVRPEETLRTNKTLFFAGGKGLNQSIAISRAGANVIHAGCVGMNDGNYLLNVLEKSGVNTSLIRKKETNTGAAYIQVTPEGTRSIIEYGGANLTITSDHIDYVIAQIHKGDILLLQNEINSIPLIVEKALDAGAKIALNASPFTEELKSLPLDKLSYVFLNRNEASQFTGKNPMDVEGLISSLRETFSNADIILTMGMKGSMLITPEDSIYQGIYDVDTKDKTAAGDAFIGFYLGTIMCGACSRDAIMMAAKAAAICASRAGASSSIPMAEECYTL